MPAGGTTAGGASTSPNVTTQPPTSGPCCRPCVHDGVTRGHIASMVRLTGIHVHSFRNKFITDRKFPK